MIQRGVKLLIQDRGQLEPTVFNKLMLKWINLINRSKVN